MATRPQRDSSVQNELNNEYSGQSPVGRDGARDTTVSNGPQLVSGVGRGGSDVCAVEVNPGGVGRGGSISQPGGPQQVGGVGRGGLPGNDPDHEGSSSAQGRTLSYSKNAQPTELTLEDNGE